MSLVPRQKAKRKSGSLNTQNAMTPLNWAVGIVETIFAGTLLITSTLWLQIFFAMLILIVMGFYFYAYGYFMLNDPDRLQSESFNLQSQELTLLGSQPLADANIQISSEPILVQGPIVTTTDTE